MTYKDVIYKLNNNIPFTFSQYGLAEWNCMLGLEGQDVNGTAYTPELRLALQTSLKSKRTENDIVSVSKEATQMYGDKIDVMSSHYGIQFADADIFAKQYYYHSLDDLFSSAERYSVVLVAPSYYMELKDIYHWGYCRIDRHDWYNKNYSAIMYILEKLLLIREPILMIWVAGMGAKPAIQRVKEIRPDITSIDIGSALDPYTGYATRNYHSKKNPNLKPINLYL